MPAARWTSNGASTSVGVSLTYGTTYYWHVRAINSFGTTYSNGASDRLLVVHHRLPAGTVQQDQPEQWGDGPADQPDPDLGRINLCSQLRVLHRYHQ